MKLFGWALILAGGGLVVVGIRQTLKGFQPDETADLDYEPVDDGSRAYDDLNDGI